MSVPRTLVATDLDRTMIYSAAALALPGPDEAAPTLICTEVYQGVPLSFSTATAVAALQQVHRSAVLVPVTTRTDAQYRRVRFPGIAPAFAVTSNGGSIVVDGAPDAGWAAAVRRRLAETSAPLAEVVAEVDRRAGDWVLKRRTAEDLFCYLVAEPSTVPDGFVADWDAWCRERGWWVSVQGRKIYAIPLALTKERALAEVAARAGTDRTLAAGDGALDAGFLTMADAAMRPPHGELHQLGWTAAGVSMADVPGVLAGEQIARWFAAEVDAARPAVVGVG
ncbi:HAD family hydrolase [Nakamurella leprariae]|uniref:HAD family hydrolase n=1 Tax=Nakamurella leprariae TaxID=2803911 RepID=A0A938Y8F3_9ACTN|nr:HAD family hydrolase [Nakamurella leprariae]